MDRDSNNFELINIKKSTVIFTMTLSYFKDLDKYAESNVIIIGAKYSELSAVRVLKSAL